MEKHHHHHHRSIEEQRREKALKIFARILFMAAVLTFVPYLAIEFFPFLKSVYVHHKINMTTMSYILLRIALMGIPMIVAAPEKLYQELISLKKIDLLSRWFAVTSFLFFTGLVVDIMSYNIFGGYEDLGDDPIMIKMLWGDIGLNGLIFCFLQGTGYFILWKKIKKHKKTVVITFAVTYALYMLCPIIYGIFENDLLYSQGRQTWFFKNIWFFISNALLVSGIAVAALKRRIWGELIWK